MDRYTGWVGGVLVNGEYFKGEREGLSLGKRACKKNR
jgi:hypothetical protein